MKGRRRRKRCTDGTGGALYYKPPCSKSTTPAVENSGAEGFVFDALTDGPRMCRSRWRNVLALEPCRTRPVLLAQIGLVRWVRVIDRPVSYLEKGRKAPLARLGRRRREKTFGTRTNGAITSAPGRLNIRLW
jgi:hypothetical protein